LLELELRTRSIICYCTRPCADEMEPLADEDPLCLLLAAILRPEVHERDGVVTLPDGVRWPDLASNVLFVRYFYKDLWEKVLQHGIGSSRAAVLLGSPGSECSTALLALRSHIALASRINATHRSYLVVAKSAFGLYVLYRTVKERRTVIYYSRKGSRALFKGSEAYLPPSDPTKLRELIDDRALYISDSLPPVASKGAFTLVITSPKKDNWSEFAKSKGVLTLVAPRFSVDEMRRLRSAAFEGEPSCTETEMLKGIALWGANPRNVLTHAANVAWQKRLSAVTETLSIATLERALQTSTALDGVSGDENCHRHIDIVPCGALPDSTLATADPTFYEFHHAELVSEHVLGMYAGHLLKRDAAELHRFLHRASDDPAIADFRGRLYERVIALPALKCGGDIMKSVAIDRFSPATSGLTQPALLQTPTLNLSSGLPLHHFRSVEDLPALWAAVPGDAVFVPLSKQFPVVDMVLRVGGVPILANATVSARHDIKVGNDKFVRLLDAIGLNVDANTEISFLWILPAEAFRGFTEPGRLLGASNTPLVSTGSSTQPIGKRVVQYKALLEVPR
jgi:hypothetical protein